MKYNDIKLRNCMNYCKRMDIIDILKTSFCNKDGHICIYMVNGTIIIESEVSDRDQPFCFIEALRSSVWENIDSSTKILLRNFMIDRDDKAEFGSIYCAKWMIAKYGYDSIKQCRMVKYKTFSKTLSRHGYLKECGWYQYDGTPDTEFNTNITL